MRDLWSPSIDLLWEQGNSFHAKNVVQCAKQSTNTSVHFKRKNPITPPESSLANMYSESIYNLKPCVTLEFVGLKCDQNFGSAVLYTPGIPAGYERRSCGITSNKNVCPKENAIYNYFTTAEKSSTANSYAVRWWIWFILMGYRWTLLRSIHPNSLQVPWFVWV